MPKTPGTSPDRPTLIDVAEGRSALPRTVAPMRPRLAAAAFNSPEHFFEVKWDGIRALVSSDAAGIRVVDRHGGDLMPLVPELRQLKLPHGTLLDGELIVCDSRGRPSYEMLSTRLSPKAAKRGRGPLFVAFDLLYDDHKALLGLTLEERRRRLLGRGFAGGPIAVPEHLENDGEPFLDVVEEYGLEGIVAKRRDGRYVPGGRSADWLKCPVTPRADIVIGAVIEDPRRAGVGTILCGTISDDRTLAYAGEAHVPPFLARWLDEATRAFAGDASPFGGPVPVRPGMRWLRPKLVAIVEHAGEESGELRDARYRALRLDGRIDDCRIEVPVEVPSMPARAGSERPRLIVLHSLPFHMD